MDTLVSWFVEPLQFAFMQRGLLAALMVGIVSSIIGTFVVLRGLGFIGDALAHAVLPGVAIAFLTGTSVFVGAFVAGIITALSIGFVQRQGRLREDTAVGIVFVGAFALGVLLISSTRSYSVDLAHILFGKILAVSPADLWLIGGFGLAILAVIGYLYKEFVLISFDPVMAATVRLPVARLNNLLLVLLSLTIVISLRAVGNVLSIAMVITPAATAYLLTNHLPRMMALAALFGALAAVIGLYLSYWMDVASGAAIVLTSVIFFFIALSLTRNRRD